MGGTTADQVNTRTREQVWIALLLVVATAIAYAPIRGNGFVDYDDHVYVVENPHVQEGFTRDAVAWAFNVGYGGNWHPLTWLSHLLDVRLYGLEPLGHHLTSVGLHALSAVVLFCFWWRTTRAPGPSAFVAGIFAVHPLHVESVAWAAERKDVLSVLLGLLSLCCWADWRLRRRRGAHLAALALFALGLAAKPMLVSLPVLFLLLELWPLRSGGRAQPGTVLKEALPFFALALVSSGVTYVAQGRGGALMAGEILPLGPRVANALVSYVSYVWTAFVPRDLCVFYPHALGSLSAWRVAGAALVLTVATVAALRARESGPWWTVGWLWFVLTLVPVIGIVQVGLQARADRYMYLPMIGLSSAIAFGARESLSGLRGARAVLRIAAVLALAVCVVLTRRQVGVWKDTVTLFTHAVEATTDNAVAHHRAGFALFDLGRTDEALAHCREALRIWPRYAPPYSTAGLMLQRVGRNQEAVELLRIAVRLDPDLAAAHVNLGNALEGLGQIEEGEREIRAGLVLAPDVPEAHNDLGVLLARSNRLDEAELELRRAIGLRARYADARLNLANVLELMGRRPEAAAELREVLRIDPADEEARAALERATRGEASTR